MGGWEGAHGQEVPHVAEDLEERRLLLAGWLAGWLVGWLAGWLAV